MFKFKRGVWVRDRITGFSGVIVGRQDSIALCNKYCIQPVAEDSHKLPDAYWFDEVSLEVDDTKQRIRLDVQDHPPG